MSACDYCGAPVRFVLLEEAKGAQSKRWSRPMESVARAIELSPDEEHISVVESFRLHACGGYQASQERKMEDRIKDAQSRECPECGVDPGQRCENLLERRRGRVKYTVWPHQERLDDETAS